LFFSLLLFAFTFLTFLLSSFTSLFTLFSPPSSPYCIDALIYYSRFLFLPCFLYYKNDFDINLTPNFRLSATALSSSTHYRNESVWDVARVY
jgi:hypothetical protein